MRPTYLHIAVAIALLAAVAAGTWLRTSRLDLRPMHTDEAIQAERLGALMGGEGFDYNPSDGHGPGLLYFSAPVAWLSGVRKYSDQNEANLRLTPALFGIGLILATALFWRPLGGVGVAAAATLVALSPMHVYYSRYFIMELPMVFLLALFLFCLWRYLEKPTTGWMVAAGICGALMHATKETFAISIAALVLAIVAVAALERLKGRRDELPACKPLLLHLAIGLVVSALLSAALYSCFFTNPQAIPDSYTTYLNYLDRSEGSGHEKPFSYYLSLLCWKKMELFTWSEALVLSLAAVGGVAVFLCKGHSPKQRIFLRILAIYALVTLLVYSKIPYKTPWSILAFLHASTLLAGAGVGFLCKRASALGRVALCLVFAAGCWHLYRQDQIANFRFPANADRNPYVYSHTTPKLVSKLVAEVQDELIKIRPELTVQVFHPETGWPLPWYFRSIKKAGYYPSVTAPVVADVVVADSAFSAELQPLLGDRYIGPTPVDLRDNVPLDYYIERELFFEMVSRRPITQP
jgi:uncharacterized protein (TIGR03663 family)